MNTNTKIKGDQFWKDFLKSWNDLLITGGLLTIYNITNIKIKFSCTINSVAEPEPSSVGWSQSRTFSLAPTPTF